MFTMKAEPPPARWECNSPREMGRRLLGLGVLAGVAAGLALLIAAAMASRFDLGGLGAALLLAARAAQQRLDRADPPWAGAVMGDLELLAAERAVGDSQVTRLVGLLQELNELERRRGSPAFDPWALQALRHDIRMVVGQDPALGRLFHT